MTPKIKLISAVSVELVVLILSYVIFMVLGNDYGYARFGPAEYLVVFSIRVNRWSKWTQAAILSYMIGLGFSVTENVTNDLILLQTSFNKKCIEVLQLLRYPIYHLYLITVFVIGVSQLDFALILISGIITVKIIKKIIEFNTKKTTEELLAESEIQDEDAINYETDDEYDEGNNSDDDNEPNEEDQGNNHPNVIIDNLI